MRLLLDTHIYLWCVSNDKQLSKKARALIESAEEVFVSSASIWEAAIKNQLGKLEVNIGNLVNAITLSGFVELSITNKHAALIDKLPCIHRDPFDRILIAQAMNEPLRLLTSDKILKKYSDVVELI